MLDFIYSSVEAGGWVIYPIYLTSILGWFLGIKLFFDIKGYQLKKKTVDRKTKYPNTLIRWIKKMDAKEQKTLHGSVLLKVYSNRHGGEKEMLNALDEEIRFFQPRLEKGLSTIGIMGSIAPLLGLLGTVSGMVGTFRTISVFGAGNPALMADSIAESLVTTQNGLLAALPLMLLHNYLWNKSVNLEKDVLKSSQRLINYLGNNDFNARLKL